VDENLVFYVYLVFKVRLLSSSISQYPQMHFKAFLDVATDFQWQHGIFSFEQIKKLYENLTSFLLLPKNKY